MRLKYVIFLAVLLILSAQASAQVSTGLDELIAHRWAPLRGKDVGLITNQTGRARDGEFGDSLFARQTSFHLVALYAPEHGIMGDRPAGVPSDSIERIMGVPVYSLYGRTRKPTKTILRGVNALVFDIQDIGVRPYTFLSTMVLAMESAAEQGIPFFVLDRPNPLSGERVEGNMLDTTLKSFVGQVPVPYLHGMTLGEIATMAKAKGWFNQSADLKLMVIPMRGWKRSMEWKETGLVWTAPSPNIPTYESAVGAAMFGATGELGVLSIGVGSDAPFLRLGSTLLTTGELLRFADSTLPKQLLITPEDFTGTSSAGIKNYRGIKVLLPQNIQTIPSLYEGQYRMLEALLTDTAFRTSFDEIAYSSQNMFAKVTGTHALFDALKHCEDLSLRFAQWNREAELFRQSRAPYLLYP
jgi:uncharacterized protein YbbC (DUF1343 family)